MVYYGSREGAVRGEAQVRGQFGYWKNDQLHGVVVEVANDKLVRQRGKVFSEGECLRDCKISQIADLQLRFDKLGFKQFISGITGEINGIEEAVKTMEQQVN